MSRTFEDTPAVRAQTPLLVGLYGPSGGGKTFSGLRLATGIQRVAGGDIFVLDTEARRALHYADKFKFRHVPFGEPFSPLDYLEAIKYCVDKGARTVMVDSMSHEHEGPGGVLEWHEKEVERLSGGDAKKAERIKMLAWAKPKAARRRLINSLLQMNVNFIFCFRAKEKIKIVTGKEPVDLGWMPIAGDEYPYEMTLNGLLLPSANGVPTWQTPLPGERMMIKLPEPFKPMFAHGDEQLTEDVGEKLARWAAGGEKKAKPTITAAELVKLLDECDSVTALALLEELRRDQWATFKREGKEILAKAAERAKARLIVTPTGGVL